MELIFDKRSDANGALDILRLWAALQAGDDPCSLSLSRPLEVRCRGASSARSPGGFCGRVLQSGRLTLTLPNLTVATRAGTAGLWSAAGHAAAYNMGQYVPMVNPRGRWRCGRRGRRDRCHQLCGRRGSRGANKCGTDHRAPRHGANMGTAPRGEEQLEEGCMPARPHEPPPPLAPIRHSGARQRLVGAGLGQGTGTPGSRRGKAALAPGQTSMYAYVQRLPAAAAAVAEAAPAVRVAGESEPSAGRAQPLVQPAQAEQTAASVGTDSEAPAALPGVPDQRAGQRASSARCSGSMPAAVKRPRRSEAERLQPFSWDR